jgi:hypothetical protein
MPNGKGKGKGQAMPKGKGRGKGKGKGKESSAYETAAHSWKPVEIGDVLARVEQRSAVARPGVRA